VGGEEDGRGHFMGQFMSGAAGAAITAIAAIIIASNGDSKTPGSNGAGPTRTVTRTVTKYVHPGSGATPCSGSRVTNDPPFEPNNLVTQAYGPLKSGEPVEAELEESADVDFFALCVSRAATLRVAARQTGCVAPEGSDTACDFVKLQIINEDGAVLKESEVSEDTTVGTIQKRIGRGRYYVRLSDGQGFRYELTASAGNVPLRQTVPAT
jgi:hypothetical protein